MRDVQNYINGKFAATEDIIDDINPATGEIIATIPKSGSDVVEEAVNAAESARKNWA